MIDGLFAYAFTTGMLATVNPCGFAMLPAYLSYFLGVESARRPRGDGVVAASRRAVAVSVAVSLGFLTVFTVIGAIVRAGGDVLIEWAKYVTIPIGLALAGLGVAMVLGYHLPFTTPRLDKGGRDRTVPSMFVFGISYASRRSGARSRCSSAPPSPASPAGAPCPGCCSCSPTAPAWRSCSRP